MSAMITTHNIYLKLDKIGQNTLKVVPTPTTTTENKKLSCRREAARCFVFVCSQLQHTEQFFISSYCCFRFTSA